MRTILYALLLSLFISCGKEKPVEKITLNGTVSDVNNNLLDGVEVKLYKSTIMYGEVYVDKDYSKVGVFKIEFVPKDGWNYRLHFKKEGYINKVHLVDKKKEKQHLDIIMEREEE
ncbi:MAG: hypothetical protein FWC39_01010 [Bacteroidetes bacterium]|nr:hypothetical protein [Bacteroidota bacterium]